MSCFVRILAIMTTLLCGLSASALAQEEFELSELSQLDKHYMTQQRESLGDITSRSYGRQFTGAKSNDLELLQRLLDDRLVRNDQTRELQAMGIVMGDLLAAELGLHWVIYEDRLGRSRALRYRETDSFLFPATMISRRREVDNRTPVAEIYNKAKQAIAPAIPALPFQ